MVTVIAGPTGVGKTALSIEAAKRLNAEVISADSVQVYKGLNIGSAKIKQDEMQGIRHHMIDIIEPDFDFDVISFRDMARKSIDKVIRSGKAPILVGGTGFYIQAVVRNVEFLDFAVDEEYRRELYEISAKENGNLTLHKMLEEIDPESAEITDKNNVKRLIRALEFYKASGIRISEHNNEQRQKNDFYEHRLFVLTDDRKLLYDRIDKRVDKMIEDGLIDEVKELYRRYPNSRILRNSIGYKEIIEYLNKNMDLSLAVDTIKKNSRHFAKRQLTWFKAQKNAEFVDIGRFNYDYSSILEYLKITV